MTCDPVLEGVPTLHNPSTEKAIRGLRKFRKGAGTEMCEILPHLYLGSLRDATDEEQLLKFEIKHIISVHDLTSAHPLHAELRVMRVQLSDCATATISKYFVDTNKFIHESRLKREAVLVHCLAGVSRSATVIAAYLMTISEVSYFNALSHITSRRPIVNPNFGFRMQLCKYSDKTVVKERERLRTLFGMDFDDLWENDRRALGHRSDLCLYQPGPRTSTTSTYSSRVRDRQRRATTQITHADISTSLRSHALSSSFSATSHSNLLAPLALPEIFGDL